MFLKEINYITTYATYMESLEPGGIVGSSFANAGEMLKPMRSQQYEVGIKAEVRGLLLTAALFQIDKSNNFRDQNNRQTQDGRQVHNGLELSVQGRLFEDLTLYGGYTYLDPQIKKANNSALNGKEPVGISHHIFKMYAEYDIPFLEGLTLTGGVYYMGSTYRNYDNTERMPGYTTADLGARYTTDYFGFDTTFRLNVTNITNEKYWIIDPLESIHISQPRTLSFSATVSF